MPEAPPILEKTGKERVPVVRPFQIPIVLKHVKHSFDRMTIELVQLAKVLAISSYGIIAQPAVMDGRFREEVERDFVKVRAQYQFEPALIVIEAGLAARPEHLGGVNDFHIVEGCLCPPVAT